ncbi:MAG: MYXO-CTERM sorting domain-containing protein [Deltaproteobacteria bacterium]|jgi:MYXO-CTERM domain-containing protein
MTRHIPSTTIPLLTFVFASTCAIEASATSVGPVTQLATPAGSQRAPAISWDPVNEVYVIVWEDGRNGANGIDLYVARIGEDGTIVDSIGLPVLAGATELQDDELAPDIVFNSLSVEHVITWQEVRPPAAFTDIWATRFSAQGPGTVVPSAGVQITSGTASESGPVIETTGGQLLLGWQVVEMGTRFLRGRRVFPDLTLVEPAFDVTTTIGTTPAVAAAGSNFFYAWEAGADLFGRVIPDVPPNPTPNDITISAANLAQTVPSLTVIGSNVVAVWEDARSSTSSVTKDIWAQVFDTALTPVGMPFPVSEAQNDQVRPRIAGHAGGGLAVWQDRRNSVSTAITYGARLNATGAVQDVEGFPILAFQSNAFEHAVAKGPSGSGGATYEDYLVASVAFGQPSRISYRIVRDELPGGPAMTGLGDLMVPADGVTQANVTFGLAQGDSGLPVVGGTLYTLSLSNNMVTVVQADADPSIPGHQIRSGEGTVSVSMTSLAHVLVDVTVTSVEGTSSGTVQVEFLNVPPVATNALIAPAVPRSDEDLTLSYTYSDINSDPETNTRIRWLRNTAIQNIYNDMPSVPSMATRRGDLWRVQVTPNDGLDLGQPINSNIVEIGNTPPVATNLEVRYQPAPELVTGTPITAFYAYSDLDMDSEGPTELRWYLDGAERTDLAGMEDVAGTEVIKDQSWYFTIRPNDNTEFGELVQSPAVTVINTEPVAVAGQDLPVEDRRVLERRVYQLDGTRSSDIDPQDTLTYTWRQVIRTTEPEVTLSDTSSATPSFTAPSVTTTQQLRFELVVNDGDEDSSVDFVIIEITPVADGDADGLDDEEEAIAGTDPTQADTDRDGLRDRDEVEAGTDPLDEDTDDDGVRDGGEGRTSKNGNDFAPLGDADGDGIINALDPDSDDDGLFDGTEISIIDPRTGGGEPPYEYAGTDESAGFFIADEDPSTGTNPNLADTDEDTFLDGDEDANHNGRVDAGESDPNDPADPGIPCDGMGNCPGALVCMGGMCVPDTSGNVCPMKLPATLQCCMGGCNAQATEVDAICPAGGTTERCPVGAQQCAANTCMAADAVTPPAEGCNCAATKRSERGGLWGLVLLAAFVVRRRR